MLDELTIPYKTATKAALKDSLGRAFSGHPDKRLATETKVSLEFPTTQAKYPAVVLKFYGRTIQNVGVGHYEIINGFKRMHYWFTGDIEFELYALDPLTRDLLADSLVQIITAGRLESWSNEFFRRLYDTTAVDIPSTDVASLTVNSDQIQEFGETQTPTPWKSDDTMVYSSSFRVNCMGEFYSLPPSGTAAALIKKVLIYPYMPGDTVPTGTAGDAAPWKPPLTP